MSTSESHKPAMPIGIDDEDLDDLDDIVDQFDTTPSLAKPPIATPHVSTTADTSSTLSLPPVSTTPSITATDSPPVSAQPGPSAPSPPPNTAATTSEADLPPGFAESFEREFAKGMESLMREISGSSSFPVEDGQNGTESENAEQKQLRAAWEAMLIQELGGENFPDIGSEGLGEIGPTEDLAAGGTTFQQSIQQTMEKLKKSESNLQTDPSSTTPSSDNIESLEALLAQLGTAGPDGLPGPESEEALQEFLETMMSQLMSKDVLYEPLKELHTKFPGYLKENSSTLSEFDRKRYESQASYVSQILAIYDDPKFSEGDAESTGKIVNIMTEIQSLGSPPPEIMGPIPGTDGVPPLPENCIIA